MLKQVMKIFYDGNCLPFKDQERSVHYPVVGGAFMGASNTTEVRFYIDQIGGESATWVCISKLPNGKRGAKIMSTQYDSELGENYAYLELSSFYTQAKGDLYLTLAGYDGGIVYQEDEETNLFTLLGTPTIQATGSVKLNIAYATEIAEQDQTQVVRLEDIMALAGEKLNKNSNVYIKVVNAIANINSATYEDYLQAGDLVYDKTTQSIYSLTKPSDTFVATLVQDIDSVGGITLASLSGSLSANQLILANKECAFAIYNGELYNRISKSSTTLVFAQEWQIFDDTIYLTIGRYKFNVNATTGEISNVELEQYEVYSKTHADDTFIQLTTNQTISGEKTFVNLAYYTGEIGDNADSKVLVNKEYVDRKDKEIAERSDVVDVVGTYSALQSYNTSTLTNNDVVKVLADSTHNNATTYYRWVITNNVGAWTYVGQDNVYSKEQTDSLLATKQDKLVAGANIQIANDGKTISATDTTYSADSESGLKLTATTFSIDPTIIASQTDIATLVRSITYSVSGDNANITYTLKNNNSVNVNFPLANTTNAGLMSPDDVNALAVLGAKVAVLEGVVHRLLYTDSANPTANEILAFVNASGYTEPTTYYGIKVVVSATEHVWVWFENLQQFQDVGLEVVLPFTNSTAGSITGSTSRGKVYAESDGTGSVVGWDDLNNNIASQYSSSNTYAIGDLVIYNGKLYVCNTAITTAETWDSNHWTETNIPSVLTTELSKKLDKYTDSGSKVYGVVSGSQTMFGIGQGATANNVVQRTSSGQVNVPTTPTADEHASSKSYVDTQDAKKLDKVIYEGLAETNDAIRELDYDKISVIGLTANTTLTLKTAPSVSGSGLSAIPTYKAIITNNANASITLTLPNGTICRTNDIEIEQGISANTFALGSGKSVELTIYNGGCEIINKGSNYQLEITSSNKLASDLVDDTNQSNKFVSANEKNFVESEWEKTLNLFNPNDYTAESNNIYVFNGRLSKTGIYTISANTTMYRFDIYEYNGSSWVRIIQSDNVSSVTFNVSYITRPLLIYIFSAGGTSLNPSNVGNYNIMLNEGSVALPYQEPHGPVTHNFDLLNLIYPVGAVYMSATNTNPSTFLGGTWSALGVHYIPKGDVPVWNKNNIDNGNRTPFSFVYDNGEYLSALTECFLNGRYLQTKGDVISAPPNRNSINPNSMWSINTNTTYNTAVYLWQRTA